MLKHDATWNKCLILNQILPHLQTSSTLVGFLQIGNTLRRCCDRAPNCECDLRADNCPVLLPSPTDEEELLSEPPQQRPPSLDWVTLAFSLTLTALYRSQSEESPELTQHKHHRFSMVQTHWFLLYPDYFLHRWYKPKTNIRSLIWQKQTSEASHSIFVHL